MWMRHCCLNASLLLFLRQHDICSMKPKVIAWHTNIALVITKSPSAPLHDKHQTAREPVCVSYNPHQ